MPQSPVPVFEVADEISRETSVVVILQIAENGFGPRAAALDADMGGIMSRACTGPAALSQSGDCIDVIAPAAAPARRVVVLALGSSDAQLAQLHDDLSSATINAGIRGDAAIITDENGVRSFRVGEQFPSGEMPPQMMIIWYANQHSALLALLGLLLGALVGGLLYRTLKQRERKRLNPEKQK